MKEKINEALEQICILAHQEALGDRVEACCEREYVPVNSDSDRLPVREKFVDFIEKYSIDVIQSTSFTRRCLNEARQRLIAYIRDTKQFYGQVRTVYK